MTCALGVVPEVVGGVPEWVPRSNEDVLVLGKLFGVTVRDAALTVVACLIPLS